LESCRFFRRLFPLFTPTLPCAGENNVFGDPAKGQVKSCECEESLPEEGIESPTGLEPGDDILDEKFLKEGAEKVKEDEATAARGAAAAPPAPPKPAPASAPEPPAVPDAPSSLKKAAAAASATATKPKAFLSAGEKFKAERDKMKAGLNNVKKVGK
jgi:hypothetical protein